ncbi:MAG: hypothetical protein ACHQIO_08120, partial [Nevskiales bacterium]
GASTSQFLTGAIVHHFSYHAGFLFCAVIAAGAFFLLLLFMPETRLQDEDENESPGTSPSGAGNAVPQAS